MLFTAGQHREKRDRKEVKKKITFQQVTYVISLIYLVIISKALPSTYLYFLEEKNPN